MRARFYAVAVLLACGGGPADTVTISVKISVPQPVFSPVAVASDPPGIACDRATVTCAAEFPRGTRVQLRAPHDALVGHTWGGICAGEERSEICTFVADQGRRVPITFGAGSRILPIERPLDVEVRGEGTIVGSRIAIVCPPVCAAPWISEASISAEPAPGSNLRRLAG